jgi:hypothetical protein
MTDLSPRRALTSWWGENRRWAGPVGCLALFLPALSLASCAGAILTFVFGAVKVGTSLRKRE